MIAAGLFMRGQTNFNLINNQNQSGNTQTLTIGGTGLTRTGSTSTVVFSATNNPNTTNDRIIVTVPNTWVRLVRSGTTITAYKSTTRTTLGSTC